MSGFDDYLASASSSAPAAQAGQQPSFDAYLASAGAGAQGALRGAQATAQPTAAANRAAAITQALGTSPYAMDVANGALEAKNALDSHLSPDSWLRKAGDYIIGNGVDAAVAFNHHLQNLPLSVGQLAAHGAAAAGDAMGTNALDSLRNNLDTYAQNREQTYQAGIPTDLGSSLGAVTGEVAPLAMGGEVSIGAKLANAADRATAFAKGIPLAQKALSGALQGATYGAMNPITSDGSFASQKLGQMGMGAALGGTLPVLGSAASSAYGVAKPIINPNGVATDFLQNILGNQAPQVAQYLRSAPTYVPGSLPTSAQAAGVPQLVQAEKALANQFPDFKTALMDRAIANNTARTGAVQGIAGDAATMQALKDARRAAIDPYVQQSLTPGEHLAANRWAGAQDAFQNVLDNPARMPSTDFDAVKNAQKIVNQVRSGAMQEDDGLQALGELGDSVSTQKAQAAFQQASSAINRNMVDPSGVLRTIATIRNGPLGVNADRAAKLDALAQSIQNATNINGLTHTTMLDAVRQEASKILGNASDQSALAYAPARNSLVQAIDRVAPGYADYLANYATHSTPITDAAAATDLLGRAPTAMVNGQLAPQFTLSGYRAGLKQAMNGDYPLSPGTQQTLQNVQNDLSRETASNSVRMGGSDTAYNLASKPWLLSKMLGTLPFGVGPFIHSVANAGNARVGQAVSRLMLDPKAMAAELEKLRATNPGLLRMLAPSLRQGAVIMPPALPQNHP